MRSLEEYRGIIGDEVISSIYRKARRLYGVGVLHINSTYVGGGVAEMLTSLVPLMNDVGLQADWRTFHGSPDFFTVTKKFHNALQGDKINLTENKKKVYLQTNENFSTYCHLNHNFIIVHDPQPLPLIKFYKKKQPWIWRCHIDLTNPNRALWEFLKKFLLRYDIIILSSEKYKRKDLPVEQRIIYPAIDPLSPKNMELSEKTIRNYLKKFNIPTDKPIITQISRFDKWKDPEGVLEVYKMVKEEVNARLVLCGSMAPDDPEGWAVLERVRRKAKKLVEKGDVILINSENSILVNVLQRVSSAVIQKSLREGFALVVTEAIWKGTPVVASNVGGIPLQIKDGENGFLVEPTDLKGFAERLIYLLKNPKPAKEMGKKGKEMARKNFLITRLLSDYLDLLNYLRTFG
ncbi:MAG TPA: glycosyltransferase [candidate division WOR-3 bacterium]|uniref:Glycosyltransferase n=1 Tax=candidate division WOR-3 bacterium TaxID=2052148 RepID=A0A7C1BAW7_UNCW3|nr:glycosyltransferase [candidate division WOR-3 bacterium]